MYEFLFDLFKELVGNRPKTAIPKWYKVMQSNWMEAQINYSFLYQNSFNPLEKLTESETIKSLFVLKRDKRKRHMGANSEDLYLN